MTLVFDASAVMDLLVRNERGESLRRRLGLRPNGAVVTVAHLDAEVFSGLAHLHRAGALEAKEVTVLLQRLSDMMLARMPITADLLDAAWDMRHNIAARDALYVALARGLGAKLASHAVTRLADIGEAAGDGAGVAPRVRRRRTSDRMRNVRVAQRQRRDGRRVSRCRAAGGTGDAGLDIAVNATTYGCIIASRAIGVSSRSEPMVSSGSSCGCGPCAARYDEHATDDIVSAA